MKLTTTFLATILFSLSAYAEVKIIDAEDASSIYPGASKLGLKAEGASVNSAGIIHATDGSDILNLKDGSVVLKGPGSTGDAPTSQLASSRFLRNGDLVAGDAIAHKIYIVKKGGDPNKPSVLLESDEFLQPNDMAVTGCGRYLYFSGMNYTADSVAGEHGELAWVDLWASPEQRKLHKVSKELLAQGKVFRSNGIEVIDTKGKEFVYLTSAENKGGAVASTRIIKWEVDKRTGQPQNPTVALDIAEYLVKNGVVTQELLSEKGMDPDGMRADLAGNLYMTLNAFKAVLRWHPETGKGVYVKLKTVEFPTNLELGGPNGSELYVVGKCDGNKASCIDVVKFEDHNVGRAFAYQNRHKKAFENITCETEDSDIYPITNNTTPPEENPENTANAVVPGLVGVVVMIAMGLSLTNIMGMDLGMGMDIGGY